MTACRLSSLVLAAALLASACEAPPPTGPTSSEVGLRDFRPPTPGLPGFPVERPVQFPATPANRYMCSLVIYPGNGLAARHVPFRLDRGRVGAPEAAEAPLERMVYLRWDRGSRRKLLEIDCVVPARADVRVALQGGFEAAIEGVVNANQGSAELAFRGERPVEPGGEFASDWIVCWWYSSDDSLVCNGVSCMASSAELRVGGVDEVAIGSFYECANGCGVAPHDGTFACSGGGGGVETGGDPGEGGGGGGGGGEWSPSLLGAEGSILEMAVCDTQAACNLAPPDQAQIDSLLSVVAQLPTWARELLQSIILDSVPRIFIFPTDTVVQLRFQIWTNQIPHPDDASKWIPADVHHDLSPGVDPHARFHFYMGVGWLNAKLRETLCHEAVHVYFDYRDDTPEHAAATAACVAGTELEI